MKWVIATLLPILFNAVRDEKHKLDEVARFFEVPCCFETEKLALSTENTPLI